MIPWPCQWVRASRTLPTKRLCRLSEFSLPRLISLCLGLWICGPECPSSLPPWAGFFLHPPASSVSPTSPERCSMMASFSLSWLAVSSSYAASFDWRNGGRRGGRLRRLFRAITWGEGARGRPWYWTQPRTKTL